MRHSLCSTACGFTLLSPLNCSSAFASDWMQGRLGPKQSTMFVQTAVIRQDLTFRSPLESRNPLAGCPVSRFSFVPSPVLPVQSDEIAQSFPPNRPAKNKRRGTPGHTRTWFPHRFAGTAANRGWPECAPDRHGDPACKPEKNLSLAKSNCVWGFLGCSVAAAAVDTPLVSGNRAPVRNPPVRKLGEAMITTTTTHARPAKCQESNSRTVAPS